MRIGKFSCDVKLEVIMIRDDCIAQFDHGTSRLLECLN